MENRFGGWIETRTGLKMFPLDPREDEICIEDIAASLSKLCRYNGHSKRFYSVAEHSFIISRWLEKQGADNQTILYGLMHDASEAYLCDIPSPIKPFFSEYKAYEKNLMDIILNKYNIKDYDEELVKQADIRICTNEKAALLNPEIKWDFSHEPLDNIVVYGYKPETMERLFLAKFNALLKPTSV